MQIDSKSLFIILQLIELSHSVSDFARSELHKLSCRLNSVWHLGPNGAPDLGLFNKTETNAAIKCPFIMISPLLISYALFNSPLRKCWTRPLCTLFQFATHSHSANPHDFCHSNPTISKI